VAQFYADIEGPPKHTPVRLALAVLSLFSREVKMLGVYPASAFRQNAAPPAHA
jgi:prephenate dehydratase